MPRLARLDSIGLLQHVMVRGIEKRDIFLDDQDRQSFVERFSKLLLKTQTVCVAWSLMTNHFHLLLRPEHCKLALFMRRLLTGYAVTFNLRHDRVGHLFQNRYKSIVCEEDTYLLQLVRYIHLNPLRAGLVEDFTALDSYPWSGHAVMMGKLELAGQETAEILVRFGKSSKQARLCYRAFIREASGQGHRDEFAGGGMIRSAKAQGTAPGEDAYDERILGRGEFVEHLLELHEQTGWQQDAMTLATLIEHVSAAYAIMPESLQHPSKKPAIANARAVICYLAVRALNYRGVEVAKLLRITPSCVVVSARRGETLVANDTKFQEFLSNINKSRTSP